MTKTVKRSKELNSQGPCTKKEKATQANSVLQYVLENQKPIQL